jgi:hypothetical protein
MSEQIVAPASAYAEELRYITAQVLHNNIFDAMLASVPEGNEHLKQAMKDYYRVEPGGLFHPQGLAYLKERDPALHGELMNASRMWRLAYIQEFEGTQ